jgi:hypothetical protein
MFCFLKGWLKNAAKGALISTWAKAGLEPEAETFRLGIDDDQGRVGLPNDKKVFQGHA